MSSPFSTSLNLLHHFSWHPYLRGKPVLADPTAEMASFGHLPNEIILGILEFVLPEDLENFAQTSQRVFLLAKPLLEPHRQLIRRYSVTFKCEQLRRDDAFWSAPIPSFFLIICNEPLIGHYIREVRLTYTDPIRYNYMYYIDQDMYRKQSTLVNAVIARSNVPKLQSFYDLNEMLCLKARESYEEFLVALFLLLLPNLNRLSFPWNPARGYFGDMIRQSALEGNSWLAKLTTVCVQGELVPKNLTIRDLSLFSSLPALKSLTAMNARDHGSDIDHFFPPADSHTKQLELNNSYFTRLALYWYLQSFQCLQTFTLAFHDYYDPFIKKQFDPNMVRAALIACAKTTLQSLTITNKSPLNPHTFLGSLQQFEALQKVRTQWTILFPQDSCLETGPSQVLPASIRELQLDDNVIYNTSKEYMTLCYGLRCAKEKTCLHLDVVEIEVHWDNWDEALIAEELGHLRRSCRAIGLSMIFRRKTRPFEWRAGSNVMPLTYTEEAETADNGQ